MAASITRRTAVKGAASLAAVAAVAGNAAAALAAEGPSVANTTPTPSFFAQPDPITDIAETYDYDVVVVGAGAAGVPAAISAFQAGVKVALLQKEDTASSQGNTCDSVLKDESDPAGVAAVASLINQDCSHRSRHDQVMLWANNSGEALKWLWDLGEQAGAQMVDSTAKWTSAIQNIDDYAVSYFAFDFGPKPYNTGNGMQDICSWAEGQGLEVFYETPACQLVQDESGNVTGVIAEKADGTHVQCNAAKGVILATGDFMNDDDMMSYYAPEMANIYRKQHGRTGDGHKMAVWAGAKMEDVCPTRVLHDFDGGPGAMCDMPFLAVKDDGNRFCNEKRCEMATMANFLNGPEDCGYYNQIFDADYMTTCADWPGKLYDEEAIKAYMPEEEGEKVGVYEGLIATYKADTIEELAEKLGVNAENLVATVERYNELCAQGADEDFGKAAKWLVPVQNPPFYGIRRHIGLSAIMLGVNVDENMQVTREDGSVIGGLFAIGNIAGNFYGSPDYPMTVPGLSLGRCHTQGYVTGKYVASL